jgi:hypothetical protein
MVMIPNEIEKNVWRRLAVPVFAAMAALCSAAYFLAAPRLGPHYDYLMKLRPRFGSPAAGPTAPGILLIETGGGNVVAASTVFMLTMTLTEMDSASLIIETPVLGVSGAHTLSEPELVYRFDEEFNIIESNIKNLFDGIKLGSIAPFDAARYVNDVIKLTEQGKGRLLSAVMQGGEAQAEQLANAAAVFGSVYIPGDLFVDVIRPETSSPPPLDRPYFPVYSRPPPDKDGKIRRIPLVLQAAEGQEYEYAAYSALKKKIPDAEIRGSGGQYVLAFKNGGSEDAGEQTFALDENASLLFGMPEGGADAFRKIELAMFLEYAETDRMLYRLLSESPALAQYADVSIENYPPFLYEQAVLSRETLLENPEEGLLERWKYLRDSYYESLDKFFDEHDGAAGKIVSAFRELGEQENLDEDGAERLDTLRNEQLKMYYTARELYVEISALRKTLKNELNGSFCILGQAARGMELSAMFANSILTGNYTAPADIKLILAVSLAAVLFSVFLMRGMGTALSFCFFILLTALCAAGFSYGFVLSGLWIDPLIPASAVAAGSFASFLMSAKKGGGQ